MSVEGNQIRTKRRIGGGDDGNAHGNDCSDPLRAGGDGCEASKVAGLVYNDGSTEVANTGCRPRACVSGRLSPSVRVSLASAMAAVGGVMFGYDTGDELRCFRGEMLNW